MNATINPQKGSALIMAMIITVIVMSMSLLVFTLAQINSDESTMLYDESELFNATESGLDNAEKQINQALANFETPQSSYQTVLGDVTVNTSVSHIQSLDYVKTDADGIVTSIQVWKLSATASKVFNQDSDTLGKTTNRLLLVAITPLFQFIAFYNSDLEINPGPNMTLTGRVHTNKDLYVGAGNTLRFDSNYVRAVGNMYRARKDNWSKSTGNVYIKNKQTGNYELMENRSQFSPPNGDESGFDSNYNGYDANGDGDFNDANDWKNWTTGAIDKWGGTVKTSVHDTNVWEAPEVQTTKPYVPSPGGAYDADGNYVGTGNGDHEKGFYHSNAQLVIIDDKAYDKDGNDITADLPAGTITEKTMFDGREEKTITVTEIDMAKLGASSHWPANGLVYATRTDTTKKADVGSSYQPNGIRMTNGSKLAAPITLVSDDPVYIKGDFNTTDKQPASVITDAINLLSNAWNDSKTDGTLPTASSTTYNCAFLTGNQDTVFNGAYNGGFENLPRFHESWSNKNCVIRGSFVNLWNSEVGVGKWVYGSDNYRAPKRDWNFDTDFFDADKLPPFTPRAVGTSQSVQWEE